MKKRQKDSARASALQTAISVALLAISAILFASSFRAAQSDQRQDGFYPPLPVPEAEGPVPVPGITVALPVDTTGVPVGTGFIEPITTTLIDPTTTSGANYVGF